LRLFRLLWILSQLPHPLQRLRLKRQQHLPLTSHLQHPLPM
jgi:hypothetical protein